MRGIGISLLAAGLAGLLFAAPARAVQIYSNDFQSGTAGSAISGGGVVTDAPAAGSTQKFLGQLDAGSSATLTLNGLTGYNRVNISFDLYTINSLDGNGNVFCCGPDYFKATYNGSTLINETFANNPGWTQSYGGANVAAGTGSDPALTGDLGYNFYGPDHTYHLSYTNLLLSGDQALFSFIGNSTQDWSDEGFGIDNIVVTASSVAATPVPAALPLFASALGGLGFVGWRRKKAQAR